MKASTFKTPPVKSNHYNPNPQYCCERCVFGTGEHSPDCPENVPAKTPFDVLSFLATEREWSTPVALALWRFIRACLDFRFNIDDDEILAALRVFECRLTPELALSIDAAIRAIESDHLPDVFLTDQQKAWLHMRFDPNSTPEQRAKAHQWLEDEGM